MQNNNSNKGESAPLPNATGSASKERKRKRKGDNTNSNQQQPQLQQQQQQQINQTQFYSNNSAINNNNGEVMPSNIFNYICFFYYLSFHVDKRSDNKIDYF